MVLCYESLENPVVHKRSAIFSGFPDTAIFAKYT